MKKIIITQIFLCISMLQSGCAFDVIRVEQIPTKLNTDASCNDSFVLAQNIYVDLSGGYSRNLKKGTRWSCLGKIAQGHVYKTKDQVLTIEASNIFEANIVVLSNKLVGFYLPVERTFSPLDNQTNVVIRETIPAQIRNE